VKVEETKENEGVEEGLISAHNPIQEAEAKIMKKRKDREVLAKAVSRERKIRETNESEIYMEDKFEATMER
jgi:hypothetical protein